jgi:dTDP-glucose 4,6-dehydratase
MTTVLLTGGAGFIGSHLCDHFLDRGWRVICLDNLSTGRLDNIKQHRKNSRFCFLRQDVCRPIRIKGRVDYVLHFASPASPRDYARLPLATLQAGSAGTLNALQVAREKRAVFILASTSEVYGDPLVSPQKESYYGNVNSVGPRSCYDEAKRFAEALTVNYAAVHRLDARIIRIFNTYGPRMKLDDGRVIPNFIAETLRGQPLTIFGNGRQTRSFCYVADLVNGIARLMLVSRRKLGGQLVLNLGNPEEYTIKELARIFARIVNRHLPLKYCPLPQDDPRQRKPDITRAKKVLGWRPAVGISRGLKAMAAHYLTALPARKA